LDYIADPDIREAEMKLRLRGNSIRLRLKRGEVGRLAAGKTLVEETQFPGSTLSYSLCLSDNDDMLASFDNGSIAISMPKEIIPEWADTDLVSLYSVITLPDDSQLVVLIEKDFSCLEPGHHRDCDDDADTYPHPSA
jgi:hypothetical protein